MFRNINSRLLYATSLLATALLVMGCADRRPDRLEKALAAAGDNRQELEAVLTHYEGDSLKLEAAKFLIINMPGHFSYRDSEGEARFYATADSVLRSVKDGDFDRKLGAMDSLMRSPTARFAVSGYVDDVKIITADYLIRNIDLAFDAWRQAPWGSGVSFEDFCETILPYKTAELQPLNDWRTALADRFRGDMEQWDHCSVYNDSPVMFCVDVNKVLRDSLAPAIHVTDHSIKILNYPQQLLLPFGACSDYSDIAVQTMRSKGMPVVKDFVTTWGYRAPGHQWNAVRDADGSWIPFGGVLTDPGQPGMLCERKAKVYRSTYARNDRIAALSTGGAYVPSAFRSPFQRDVTSEYIKCTDVEVALPDGVEEGYVYLAVSDRDQWTPVDFAGVSRRKARFTDVGFNCVYTVVRYDSRGKTEVLTPPFVLHPDGTREDIVADTDCREKVELNRKYLVFPHVASFTHRMKGGVFEASDMPDFPKGTATETAWRITDTAPYAHDIKIDDSIRAHRYWRYIQNRRWTHCNIAEIQFFDREGNELKVEKVIGTPGSFGGKKKASGKEVFDGDPLTSFDAPLDSGAWVGADFGHPVDIARIRYLGRGDGNAIEEGDKYELLYFGDGKWVSIDTKVADSTTITFNDVPCKALLLLRDLTKGREERIFNYRDGRQHWR